MKQKNTKAEAQLAQLNAVIQESLIDYGTITSLGEFKAIAGDATLIFAVNSNPDKRNGTQSVVYGLAMLEAIRQGVLPNQKFSLCAFAVDFDTDQVEHLLAAVTVTKGCHDW